MLVQIDHYRDERLGDHVALHDFMMRRPGSITSSTLNATFVAAPLVATGDLVEVTLDAEPMELGAVHAITHPTRRRSAKTRAWVDFVLERLPVLAAER